MTLQERALKQARKQYGDTAFTEDTMNYRRVMVRCLRPHPPAIRRAVAILRNHFPDFVPIVSAGEWRPSRFLNTSDGQVYALKENIMQGEARFEKVLLLPAPESHKESNDA